MIAKYCQRSMIAGFAVWLGLTVFAESIPAYDVAAYVWPAYQNEPRWAELGIFGAGKGEWQNVWEAVPKWEGHRQPLKPLWGYEDESDPKVVERKIDAAVAHGVNVFIYDWYWYGGRPFLENGLNRGFLGAKNNAQMKFFIMWANHHVNWLWDNKAADKRWNAPRWRAWVSEEEFKTLVDRWIAQYFTRPNYYRIDGKPVLMIYEMKTFVQGVGGKEAAKRSLDHLRAECVKAGLGGVHLMACDFALDREHVKDLGVDSATIYNLVHWGGLKANEDYATWAERAQRRFSKASAELGVKDYFAHASVGWDTNPRYPKEVATPSAVNSKPAKFEAALRRAKDFADRHTRPGVPRLITVNSWNEWTEGSYLEPDTVFGFGYLEAIRKVFGKVAAAGANSYKVLRDELRAFHPEECHQACKDEALVASHEKMREEVRAWAKTHPEYDALDVRREYYRALARNFRPVIFANSPFYFENGINGGWCEKFNPARVVNELCWKFYEDEGLVPKAAFALQAARQRESLALCCGPFCDNMHHVPPLRTIMAKGFKGVFEEVKAALEACPADDVRGRKELETALVGLETIHALQLKFAEAARERLSRLDRPSPDLRRIAESAARCPWEPPRSFYEGLNTIWFVREIVSLADGTDIFSLGRPDAFFIDFYRRELAAGTLTKTEARELVDKFLIHSDCHLDTARKIDSYSDQEAEMPMSLGGHDAQGNFVYNELTEMFLDSHLENNLVFPKLHARIASDAPAAYLEKIGRMLMKGHAVFTLLNDDRYIKQYLDEGFSYEDASAYIGVGCWNGFIDSVQDLDEANYLSMIKVLEMSIHRDAEKERRCALTLESMDRAGSLEELRDIYWRNFHRYLMSVTSMYSRYGATGAKVFPHPVYSMCLRGCVKSRRDTNEGGSESHPRILTLGFIGNVVDSILAIDYVCFQRKLATVGEFLAAVRGNWAGERGEQLRAAAMSAPYWGDGSPQAAELFSWLINAAYAATDGMDNGFGGAYRYAIYAYREFMYWGLNTKATPDGRRNGDRLAQGFSPSEYRCREGVTSVMNSIGMLPHEKLYASNVNLTFDASAMNERLLASILRVFCRKGSHMIQPNCNSVEVLLDAQAHPELHRDLIVRVCGFSARFVSLSKRWQDEVIARHRLR